MEEDEEGYAGGEEVEGEFWGVEGDGGDGAVVVVSWGGGVFSFWWYL